MFDNERYIQNAITGDINGMCLLLNALYHHTQKHANANAHPYQKSPCNHAIQQRALIKAVQHKQHDVVILLLNYETSHGNCGLLNEEAKRAGIAEAIKGGAQAICILLIQHLKRIRQADYNSIKQQLTHYYSKTPATDAMRDELAEIIIALLEHPRLEAHPRRALETLREFGIKHSCIKVMHYLMGRGLSLEALSENDRALIAMDFSESHSNLTLLKTFPSLQNIIDNQLALDNLDTPFIAAARCNNVALMQDIYERNPRELNRVNREKKNALMVAVESDTPAKECIAWLLKQGMSVTAPFSDKSSILEMLAANKAQCDAFIFVMSHPDPNIDAVLNTKKRCYRLLRKILKAIDDRKDPNSLLTIPAYLLNPLLALMNRKLDGNVKLSQNMLNARYFQHQLITPWAIQAPQGKHSHLSYALFANATQSATKDRYHVTPIDKKDDRGQTALHHLMLNIPQQLGNLLFSLTDIDQSGTFFATQNMLTLPAICAIRETFTDAAALTTLNKLLSYHATIDMSDNNGNTPLHFACIYQNTMMIEVLLKQGANPNQRDHFGSTPLMLACQFNTTNSIITLLNHGADPHLRNSVGQNALAYLERNNLDVQQDAYAHLVGLPALYSAPSM